MIVPKHSLGLFVLVALVSGMPAHAAPNSSVTSYSAYFENASHQSRSSSRERYSSTVQKAINKLDKDEVENLPIPVLMGVRVANLSPNFGDPRDGGAREHEGLDIMAPMGAFIASPTEAVVVRTGDGSSSGIYVTTANPGGETFTYMHLSDIADGIKTGTVLKAGELLGYVGDTGNAKGGAPHLHFEIRKSRKALDPFPRLTKEFTTNERIAVLLEIVKELQKELASKKD